MSINNRKVNTIKDFNTIVKKLKIGEDNIIEFKNKSKTKTILVGI